MINFFDSKNFKVLEKTIDGASMRHEVLSNNIANVNTPGFKRSDVNFQDALRKALDRSEFQGNKSNPKHMDIPHMTFDRVRPKIGLEKFTKYRNDENNVDITHEMAEMSKNQILYNTSITLINRKFGGILRAINSGRG